MNYLREYFYFIFIPPLMPVIIAFIMGIIFQSSWCAFTTALILIPVVALHIFLHKEKTLNMFFCILTYTVIALSGSYLYQKNIDNYHEFYLFTLDGPIDITGTVIDKSSTTTKYTTSTAITLSIDHIKNKYENKKINKSIILHGSHELDDLSISDTVTFFNVYCKKPIAESFIQYQIKEQIAATIFDNQFTFTITNHPQWSFKRWIYDQKQRMLMRLKEKLSPDTFLLFSSLFLGNRICVKNSIEKINDQFKRWGIYHLLARSGMHLALFIVMWQALLCFMPIPFLAKQLIMIILSMIYFFLSWTSAPFMRALVLLLFNKVCIITDQAYHSLHYLTLTCLCFLLYCPLYLLFLDFQLSFSITFALIWLNQLHYQHLYKEYL